MASVGQESGGSLPVWFWPRFLIKLQSSQDYTEAEGPSFTLTPCLPLHWVSNKWQLASHRANDEKGRERIGWEQSFYDPVPEAVAHHFTLFCSLETSRCVEPTLKRRG